MATSSVSAVDCRRDLYSRPSWIATQKTNRFDASQARRSLEESLKALGLDRIHLLHLHDPEHADSLEATTGAQGALPELFKMKEEGLVKRRRPCRRISRDHDAASA